MIGKYIKDILLIISVLFIISMNFLGDNVIFDIIIYDVIVSSFLLLPIITLLVFTYYFYISVLLPQSIRKRMRKIEEKKKEIDFSILGIQNINEILAFSRDLHILLKKIKTIKKFHYIAQGSTKVDIELYGQNPGGLLDWIIFCLNNLRSDLSISLTEQRQALESAKSEIESNIQGTTELNQVSEIQRIRLDKQIQQFEELQRVLVKV